MRQFYVLTSAALSVILVVAGCNQPDQATTETSSDSTGTVTQSVSFANTKCPIMGGKPKAELTAEFNGKTIGFCCEGCPEKWAALSGDEKKAKLAKASAEAQSHEADDGDHAGHDNHS